MHIKHFLFRNHALDKQYFAERFQFENSWLSFPFFFLQMIFLVLSFQIKALELVIILMQTTCL